MTLSEKALNYLIEKGCKELESSSGKYRKFTDPNNFDRYYWLGKNGAVKVGKTVTDSISITDLVKKTIQNKERKQKND